MAFDDEFVEIGGLARVRGLEREVVEDEEIDSDEPAHLDVVGVVEPGRAEPFEQPIGAYGVDLAATSTGDVTERVREVGLADPDGSEDQGRVGVVDEPQAREHGPVVGVVGDVDVTAPRFQGHRRVELGGAAPQRRGLAVAAGDLVGEDELEELRMRQFRGAGEGEPLGERCEVLPSLTRRSYALSSGATVVAVGAVIALPPGPRRTRPRRERTGLPRR